MEKIENQSIYETLESNNFYSIFYRSELDLNNDRIFLIRGHFYIRSDNVEELINTSNDLRFLKYFYSLNSLYKINEGDENLILYG